LRGQADAEARAAGLPVPTPRERRHVADQALAHAAEHIADRDAVLSVVMLEHAAGDAARGVVDNVSMLGAGDVEALLAQA